MTFDAVFNYLATVFNAHQMKTTRVKFVMRVRVYSIQFLRHRRDGIMWCPHLGQDFVEPMQRAVEVDLDPARRRRDVLTMVLGAPALDEAQSHRAHLGEFKDGLVAALDRVGELTREVAVVEDAQAAAGGYLADRRRVKAVMLVAVATLDEDGGVAETLGEYLAADIVQV